jgi:hypothetical protein
MRTVIAVGVAVAIVAGVLLLPVIIGGSYRASAPAAPDTPIPVGALGGLGLSGVLAVQMAISRRGRRRRRVDD